MSGVARSRKIVWAALLLAVMLLFLRYCVVFVPAGVDARRTVPDEAGAARLAIPVAGVDADALVDTFTQARESGARRHDAIDIVAVRGTPVMAVADGRIEKLFNSARGGTTVYERSVDGHWIYYYAHLNSYAPDVRAGMAVRRGHKIGFVGTTGDAAPDAPHLHFEVHRMAPGAPWYQGEAINPYPLLVRR